jgi:hypothetical protein
VEHISILFLKQKITKSAHDTPYKEKGEGSEKPINNYTPTNKGQQACANFY